MTSSNNPFLDPQSSPRPLPTPSPTAYFLERHPVFTHGVRYIPTTSSESRLRAFMITSVTPKFAVGFQFDPRRMFHEKRGRVNVIIDWLAVSESGSRPAIIIGTGADRLSTPTAQTFHLMINKTLIPLGRVSTSCHVGLSWSKRDGRILGIAGMNFGFSQHLSSRMIFDGIHFHAVVTAKFAHQSFSILLIRSGQLGASYSVTF